VHIVWLNESADFTGGCEQYIHQTVSLLNKTGIISTLLYKVGNSVNPSFTSIFDSCFPIVDISLQLNELAPDVIYIHQIHDIALIKTLVQTPIPNIRFFHDHRLFCLREHKYTTISNTTCSKKLSVGCYACLGFINRSDQWPGLTFSSLREKKEAIHINQGLDSFVVGSQYMATHLEEHGFNHNKIQVIPLFTNQQSSNRSSTSQSSTGQRDLNHQPRRNKVFFPPIDLMKKTQNLLFVGQLIRGKGLDILIKAMQSVNESCELTICGQGRMENIYKQQVKTLGLDARITFLGQQTQDQLSQHYKNTDIVIIPTRAPETFCLIGLEALSHGTPVVASDVGGIREWLKPNLNGLAVAPNSVVKLTEAINKLLSNPALRLKMRTFIHEDNLDRFSSTNHLNQLTLLFNHLTETA